MNMADIISKRRKEKGMTQKQLAQKLGVTDKAVSKWERGNGHPDISYLEPLAEALDITVSELLSGNAKKSALETEEENNDEENDRDEDSIIKNTLDYANTVFETRSRNIPRIITISVLVLGLIGILTTAIVDFALNNTFTWSLLSSSTIVFFWLCIVPLFLFEKNSINISLLFLSVSVLPYLFIIDKLLDGHWFRTIAIPMTIVGLILLWLIRAVFATGFSIWNKLAASMLIAGIGNIVITVILGNILADGGLDIWNLVTAAVSIIVAVILFIVGLARESK